jgi:hypothetical protein
MAMFRGTKMKLHRIYFDTNEGTYAEGYGLWLRASLNDMALITNELRDGLRVIIYMPDELEMEAILKFDKVNGAWMAFPVEGTLTHYS